MKEAHVESSSGCIMGFVRRIQLVTHWMRMPQAGIALRFAMGLIATAIYLMPLFWMVSTSLKPQSEIFHTPPVLIPSHPQIDSYRSALGLPTDRPELYITGALYFKNSFIIASSTMLLTLVLAVPAAYALSRFNFRGKTTFILFLLVAQMLPGVLLVIPLFVLFKMFSLYNTHFSVILADTALALPFAVIILRTSFIQIPDALEEAGMIDGATRLQVLWYIILPLIRASLVAVGVFSFLTAWGEFVFALSFLAKPELQPISIGVFQFIGMYKTQWDTMMAFSTLVAIPAILALLFLQRQFISGLTSGSVK
jgi:multiple sugar transport system permease protein